MNDSLTLIAEDGTKIEVVNIPQSILEYAEYYKSAICFGVEPMSFDDWKNYTQEKNAIENE
jgi:hypothetical protein